ncbi:DUF6197 family protein [Streptomyces decoyicus]|uniref:DUF6197 family protein n=1 Tax=Streptomyces decoyicus TaxID=249567 RepID=UPI0033BE0D46
MADIDIPAVLDQAAAHIDRVGWHQGSLYDPTQSDKAVIDCPVCAMGAINVALHGTPLFPNVQGEASTLEIVAVIENFLDLPGEGEDLPGWNDEPGRTQAGVTDALRDTADSLRYVGHEPAAAGDGGAA